MDRDSNKNPGAETALGKMGAPTSTPLEQEEGKESPIGIRHCYTNLRRQTEMGKFTLKVHSLVLSSNILGAFLGPCTC